MHNFYDKILHKIGKERGKDAMYVNIGAMDGTIKANVRLMCKLINFNKLV